MSLTSLWLTGRFQPPAPPTPPAPCTDLQSAINAATGGPITFGNDGFRGTRGRQYSVGSQRAGTFADFLVANGVARDHLVVNGLGSADPARQDRRVEIVVS